MHEPPSSQPGKKEVGTPRPPPATQAKRRRVQTPNSCHPGKRGRAPSPPPPPVPRPPATVTVRRMERQSPSLTGFKCLPPPLPHHPPPQSPLPPFPLLPPSPSPALSGSRPTGHLEAGWMVGALLAPPQARRPTPPRPSSADLGTPPPLPAPSPLGATKVPQLRTPHHGQETPPQPPSPAPPPAPATKGLYMPLDVTRGS